MAEIFQIAPWMLGPSPDEKLRARQAEKEMFDENALAAQFYTDIRQDALSRGATEGQANTLAVTRAGPMATMFARRTLESIREAQSQRLENIKLQNQVRIEDGLAQFTDAASKVTDWTSEEQEANLRRIASQNPIIIPTKAYENTMQLFSEARKEKRLADTARLQAETRTEIALLNAVIKDATLRQRLDEIRLKSELGFDVRKDVADIMFQHQSSLLTQRGEQEKEQIEARHQARLQEIDAKIKGTLENAPKMIRNTARVAALQSELRALESDIKLKYNPVLKAARLEEILKKYNVDVASETIKTVPGTGLTPALPEVPIDAQYGPPAPSKKVIYDGTGKRISP